MARIIYRDAIDNYLNLWAFGTKSNMSVTSKTKSRYALLANDQVGLAGYSIKFEGNGFKYSGNTPTAGVLTSIDFCDEQGNTIIRYTNIKAGDFFSLPLAFQTIKNQNVPYLLAWLSQSTGSVNGSTKSEDFFDGVGKQKIVAGDGNDTIFAYGDGKDVFDGGSGFDSVDYGYWIAPSSAPGNIIVDFANNIVRDAFGSKNTLVSIELVLGTTFGDVFNFGSKAYSATGGAGNDTFDGGNTKNRASVEYQYEQDWGGTGGIKVNLGSVQDEPGKKVKGTVTDAFGDTDQTINIRNVIGTTKNDTFKGSHLNDTFVGMAGRDKYDGKDGHDIVNFDYWRSKAPKSGIDVNLSLKGGEIKNDGFGKTETATSVEGIMGTSFKDTIKGDKSNNFFEGLEGKDILKGGKGSDYFVYGRETSLKEFGDRILDFTSGTDKLVFYKNSVLKKMSSDFTFKNGTNAKTQFDAGFFFNTIDHKIYYDPDGWKGHAAPIAIATLSGVDHLRQSDIMVVKYDPNHDWWV